MKKTFLFIALLTTSIINSKPFEYTTLNDVIQKISEHIEDANALRALLSGLVAEAILPVQLPLRVIRPIDARSLMRLSAENKCVVIEAKLDEVEAYHEELTDFQTYIQHVIEQTDQTSTTNN